MTALQITQKGTVFDGRAAHQQQHRQNDKHQIEESQDILEDNLPFRASGGIRDGVTPAQLLPVLSLRLRQSLLRGRMNFLHRFTLGLFVSLFHIGHLFAASRQCRLPIRDEPGLFSYLSTIPV